MTPNQKRIFQRACDLALKQLELTWEAQGRPNFKDFKLTIELRREDDTVLESSRRVEFRTEEREVIGPPRYEREEAL